MDAFEYLSVLISIILGLGITQLLLGFSRWLEQRGRLTIYGPAMAWAAFLLLVHIQTWWSMYGLRSYADWNILQFSVVLLQTIVLFLLAVLILPGSHAQEQDLRNNFFRQRRWFFGLLAALLVVSLLKDLVREGSFPDAPNLAFHAAFLLVAGSGYAARGQRAHALLAYFTLAAFLAYMAVLFAEL